MIKKILKLTLIIFMICGFSSNVKSGTLASQGTSKIIIQVENNESSLPSLPGLSYYENQKPKLPLTNSRSQTSLLIGGILLVLGITCFVVCRKRGGENG